LKKSTRTLGRVVRAGGLAAALALALLATAVDGAGYTAGAQGVFVAVVGLALLAAVLADEAATRAALRCAPIVVLGVLGLLGLVSAVWTLVAPVDAARWSIVVLAYGGLATASAVLAGRRGGLVALATGVALLAAAEALLGIGAAALRQLPDAERIGGTWRPGGSFEYSSALALLQVVALPALLTAMSSGRAWLAGAGGAGGALACGTLMLAGSREELALGLLVAALALAAPGRTVGAPRFVAGLAVGLIAAAGALVQLLVGGYTTPHAPASGGAGRLAGALGVVLLVAVSWPLARRATAGLDRGRPRPARGSHGVIRGTRVHVAGALLVIAICALAAVVIVVTESPIAGRGRGIEPNGGVLHGRGQLWSAAWESFLDRPLLGGGAQSFLPASAAHQGIAPTLYAHNLVLEELTELGLPGGMLAFALLLTTGMALWRARHHPAAWLVGPGAAAFLLANLVDWEWHLPLAAGVWAVQLGALLTLASPAASRAPDRDSSSSADALASSC
jgi:hypothetical protein